MEFTNQTYPDDFYEFDFYKICGLVASLINVVAVTPLVLFIIWYEKS